MSIGEDRLSLPPGIRTRERDTGGKAPGQAGGRAVSAWNGPE